MLLNTLYIPRGTERSRAPVCVVYVCDLDDDEHLDCWSARERLVGRENCGDFGGYGSMGLLR